VIAIAHTRNFKKIVVAQVERDPEFARALLDEAASLFLGGDGADRFAKRQRATVVSRPTEVV